MKPTFLHRIEKRSLQLFRPAFLTGLSTGNGAAQSGGSAPPDYATGFSSWSDVLWRSSAARKTAPSKAAQASTGALAALHDYLSMDIAPAEPAPLLEAGRHMEAALLLLREEPILSREDARAKCNVLRQYVASLPPSDSRVEAFAIALALELADCMDGQRS